MSVDFAVQTSNFYFRTARHFPSVEMRFENKKLLLASITCLNVHDVMLHTSHQPCFTAARCGRVKDDPTMLSYKHKNGRCLYHQADIVAISQTRHHTCFPSPLPFMIPTLPAWPLGLTSRILNWDSLGRTSFHHRVPEQSAFIDPPDHAIVTKCSQGFTRGSHTVVLPFKIKFLGFSLFSFEQLPCAVDGPVPKVSQAGETERTGCFGVGEEVANESCERIGCQGSYRLDRSTSNRTHLFSYPFSAGLFSVFA